MAEEVTLDDLPAAVSVRGFSNPVIEHWSRGAEELYGYSAEAALGRISEELLRSEYPVPLPEIEELVRLGGRWSGVIKQRGADGSPISAAVAWRLRRDRQGFPASILQVALPTDQAHSERVADLRRRLAAGGTELAAAVEELDAFSYSVAHDLRTPLRALNGFSRSIQEDFGAELPLAVQDDLARIQRAADRMGTLIDDLLRLSRISRAVIDRQPVDLSGLVHQLAAELATGSTRQVEWQITPGVWAEADQGLVRLALENLLANAWKFTAKNSSASIAFGVEQVGGEEVYTVCDDGAGFDMAQAGKLFTPFHRLHPTREFEGTGIGLAIVQRVVRRHGGRVWASAQTGAGAVFHFTLPALPAKGDR